MSPLAAADISDPSSACRHAWEQRQLGEVAEVHNGRDYKHLQPGNIPVYGTSGYMLSVDDALSWNEDAVGIGRKGTIDKPYILRAPFWTVDTLFFVTPRPSTPLEFLFTVFESVNWKSKDESTGVPSLTKQAIVNTAVKVPNTYEQCRIGGFFSVFDNLIAAAERQEALLRQKKQAYLQLMFPQEGETKPRLRFTGFTGEWQRRQLGDVTEIAIGQSPEGKYLNNGRNGVALAQGNTDIVNGVFVPRVWTTHPTKVVPAGTLLVSVRAPVGNVAVTPVQACIGRGFAGITGNGFLRYSLERLKISGHWDHVSSGSVLDAITSKELLQTPISITSNQEEQCIGKFFTRLDYLIEIVERQVATLETMKRAYLQKMFI